MCDIKDAQRYVKLAELYDADGDARKARECYLEACSIYLLQAEIQKKENLVDEARALYKKARTFTDSPEVGELGREELAYRTLHEQKEYKKGPDNFLQRIEELISK